MLRLSLITEMRNHQNKDFHFDWAFGPARYNPLSLRFYDIDMRSISQQEPKLPFILYNEFEKVCKIIATSLRGQRVNLQITSRKQLHAGV